MRATRKDAKYVTVDRDRLYQLYVLEARGKREVAELMGFSSSTIQQAVKYHGLVKSLGDVVATRKKTNIRRYGVSNPQQCPEIQHKTRITNLERCGSAYPLGSPEIRRKGHKTSLQRYGVECPAQRNRTIEQIELTKDRESLLGYLVQLRKEHGRKPITSELISLLGFAEPSTVTDKLREWGLYAYVDQCRSSPEAELCRLFPTDHVNTRSVVKGYELDLYYPERRLAIEFHGLYWHSHPIKPDTYHMDKFLACRNAGIRLVQIFADEWEFTQRIVIDKLRHMFGGSGNKPVIGARTCRVDEITASEAKVFMASNHIQGYCVGRQLALRSADRVVAVMTINSPQISRQGSFKPKGMEISRFATDITVSVPGAFSRLLRSASELTARLFSYADLRWVDPACNVYLSHGFVQYNEVAPAYWYWTDKKCESFERNKRYYRFNFTRNKIRKHFRNLLPADSSDWTEKQMMEYLGWYRIFDAGKLSYEYDCSKMGADY